jgi:glucosamine-6-phosphate deaminase
MDIMNATAGDEENHHLVQMVCEQGRLFEPYDCLLTDFKQAFERNDTAQMLDVECIMMLRKLCTVYEIGRHAEFTAQHLLDVITAKLTYLRKTYLPNRRHGDATPVQIQLLKGCMRETEEDRVWALSSIPNERCFHLRSKFYTDDFFTPMPTVEHDARPLAELVKQYQPNIVTVAFDPEGTGPDTHYKVLLVVAQAIRILLQEVQDAIAPVVWGYRNVWFRFHPADATLMAPAGEAELERLHATFMACFTTQKSASFPSHEFDGPFSLLSNRIQREQRVLLGKLLGEEFFASHPNPRMRESSAFVFIKAMNADDFLMSVMELKERVQSSK